MPAAEVKGVWWACITWPHKSAKLSLSSLLLGANAIKATTLDPSGLSMLCLSPYQRVFYALASWCPSQRTRDCLQTPRPKACVRTVTPTANFWAQIIFDPYRRPLTLTFLHVSTRGFSRIRCSTVCITARYPRILQKF